MRTVLIVLLLASLSMGATYYVDKDNGLDDAARNGLTPATAWATIQYGPKSRLGASETATIYVAAGTYNEAYSEGDALRSIGTQQLTIESLSGARDVTITAPSTSYALYQHTAGSGLTFKHLTISGAQTRLLYVDEENTTMVFDDCALTSTHATGSVYQAANTSTTYPSFTATDCAISATGYYIFQNSASTGRMNNISITGGTITLSGASGVAVVAANTALNSLTIKDVSVSMTNTGSYFLYFYPLTAYCEFVELHGITGTTSLHTVIAATSPDRPSNYIRRMVIEDCTFTANNLVMGNETEDPTTGCAMGADATITKASHKVFPSGASGCLADLSWNTGANTCTNCAVSSVTATTFIVATTATTVGTLPENPTTGITVSQVTPNEFPFEQLIVRGNTLTLTKADHDLAFFVGADNAEVCGNTFIGPATSYRYNFVFKNKYCRAWNNGFFGGTTLKGCSFLDWINNSSSANASNTLEIVSNQDVSDDPDFPLAGYPRYLHVTNSILANSGTADTDLALHIDASLSAYVTLFDYNCYYAAGAHVAHLGDTPGDVHMAGGIAALQAGWATYSTDGMMSLNDANSIESNPLLTSPSTGDFSIPLNLPSPALNVGWPAYRNIGAHQDKARPIGGLINNGG